MDYAAENKIIEGYGDGTFRSDASITRAEFAKILSYEDADNDAEADFPDLSSEHWAKKAIDRLYGNKRIEGYPDGTFAPDKEITRAEAVKILNGVYERTMSKDKLNEVDTDNDTKQFDDLDDRHWGYYNMVGATNNYQSEGKGDSENVVKIVSPEKLKRADYYMVSQEKALKKLGLKVKPQSTVTFGWTDALTLIESGAKIAGIPDDHHIDEAILDKYTHISDEEGNIDFEKLEELKPSSAFSSEESIKNIEGLEEKLKELNTEQFYSETKTVNDIFTNIGLLASATDSKEIAVNNLINIFNRADAIKNLSEKNENPKVALVMLTDVDSKVRVSIASKNSFAAELMELGGMKNAGDDIEGDSDRFGFVATDLEKIMDEKPDAIVLMVRTERSKRNKDEQDFYKELEEKYSDSNVVKDKKYGRIDHHGVLPKSPMVINGLEAISGVVNKASNEIPDKLKDGKYNGVGTGFAGGLNTEVEVKEGKIASIKVGKNNETSNILEKAKDKVIAAIIDKQSTKVDVVSGATKSSEGIMESVANALAKAK